MWNIQEKLLIVPHFYFSGFTLFLGLHGDINSSRNLTQSLPKLGHIDKLEIVNYFCYNL